MGFDFEGTISTFLGGSIVGETERGLSAARDRKKAARVEAEARRVSAAQQENERQAAIRKQIREERIRRAQVISAAEAVGVEGSSLEMSTIGSGQTITAAGRAFATGASESATFQSELLQQAADIKGRATEKEMQAAIAGNITEITSAFVVGG